MAQKKEYTASQRVLDAQAAVEAQKSAKPADYQSAYDAQLEQVMERILNREDFRYDLDGDALYRRYRDSAVRNGRLAMEDTMGKAAALTGGYGSSYAQSVGQQAYHSQMESLADRIPELYNLAMNQYRLQTQGLQQKYDLLSGAQKQEYQRYQDALAAWQKEADQLWQRYTDERSSDYASYRDEISDWKWQQEYDENRRRYDQQWEADHPTVTAANLRTGYAAGSGSTSGGGTSGKKTQEKKKTFGTGIAALMGALSGVKNSSR